MISFGSRAVSPKNYESIVLKPLAKPAKRLSFFASGGKLERLIFMLLGLQGLAIAVLWQYMSVGVEIGSSRFFLNVIFMASYALLMGLVMPTVLLLSRDMPVINGEKNYLLELNAAGIRWSTDEFIPGTFGKKRVLPGLTWHSVCQVSYGKPGLSALAGDRRILSNRSLTWPWSEGIFIHGKIYGNEPQLVYYIAPTDFTRDQLGQIYSAIRKWAPHVVLAPSVQEVLAPTPIEHLSENYTDLWLQLLHNVQNKPATDRLPPGHCLREGLYKVKEHLQTGGQANVYLVAVAGQAEDNSRSILQSCGASGSYAVIKEFIPAASGGEHSQARSLSYFDREAGLLASLHHTNIVRQLDYFVEGGRAYLVLEYLAGQTLRRRVDTHGPLCEREVISISLAICRALQYLHEQKPPVVHRDLSPENIVVDNNSNAKLIDFSVAVRGEQTEPGEVVGKQAYISPEQFRGASSAQSDLYSLGATMYYLLVGQDPIPITESRPGRFRTDITSHLDQIVGRLTAVDQSQRYASACTVIADLMTLQLGNFPPGSDIGATP